MSTFLFGGVLLAILAFGSTVHASSLFLPSPARMMSRKIGDFTTPNYVQEVPSFETHYYDQRIDHFNFEVEPRTYRQRYLVSKQHWNKAENAPIVFYTGNEGSIVDFWNNTGFATITLAQELQALVVFAEHRYYGDSMPFGKDSFHRDKVGYCSVEQALADYAELITVLKEHYGAQKSKVIAIGGSYGGMLSTYFRIKYPHIVDAALAASAPVLQFQGISDPLAFGSIVTRDFEQVNSKCPTIVRQAFSQIEKYGQTAGGRDFLTDKFRLCKPLEDVSKLSNWLGEGLQYMAMTDYPYPTSFLQNMPGWPVKVACDRMVNTTINNPVDTLDAIFAASSVYFNYTGDVKCFTLGSSTPSLGDEAWNYQACTELILPIGFNGKSDMFPNAPWNINDYLEQCKKQYGVMGLPQWGPLRMGGANIKASSNIIFSNGDLDPWSGGGILESLSDSLVAIVIKDGAHHLDLRTPNPADPTSVIEARRQEITLLKKWIGL